MREIVIETTKVKVRAEKGQEKKNHRDIVYSVGEGVRLIRGKRLAARVKIFS